VSSAFYDEQHLQMAMKIASSLRRLFDLTRPFKPQYPQAYSPHCTLYISYDTTWENLLERQDRVSWVIISFIIMTCIFDQVLIL